MERFLLLWDELDEIMGYGRHLAVGLSTAVTERWRRSAVARLPGVQGRSDGGSEIANPLN